MSTRKDYSLFLEIERKNGFVIVSQRINFHSFSFQIAVYLTIFFFFLLLGICLVVLLLAIINRVFSLILVKLFKIVYIIIHQGAPLGLAVEIN